MNRDILLTGTTVVEPRPRLLQAGALRARFVDGALRWLCWHDTEVIRSILFLLRTPGWGTPAPNIIDLEIHEETDLFRITYTARYGAPGGVSVHVRLSGEAEGIVRAAATIHADTPFMTNRTGFVVLHPLDGFAGTPVGVRHASGPERDLVMPAQISPGQPVMDIRAITHRPRPGLTVETRLEGEVFEMEDHRNWSDASFKTYSRPIGLPYPYELSPDCPQQQSVTVKITETEPAVTASFATAAPPVADVRLPAYALPIDGLAEVTAALVWPDALRALGAQRLLLRHDATKEAADADLDPLRLLLSLTGAVLELQCLLAATSETGADVELAGFAARLAAVGVRVDRISAFAKCDEASFQPGDPRPPHPSEAAIAAQLEQHFPMARRIGGTPAFFTEFNRKRPDPRLWHGLTFATTPSVHAADDASVLETLQALPHILASAATLAKGLPLSVGPTGIGARINPYGPAPLINDPALREGMAARDPRQRGLFAAAWTVGYLAQIASFGIERFAFGAAVGPFGLVSTRQDWARPFWDEMPEGALFPLYHVARWIASAAGAPLDSAGITGGLAQLVWHGSGGHAALIANLTSTPARLPPTGLDRPTAWVLDARGVPELARSDTSPQPAPLPETLDAYAIVYLQDQGDTL